MATATSSEPTFSSPVRLLAAAQIAPISYPRLALCLIPLALVCLLLFRTTNEGKASLLAIGRMLVQLSLVGYALGLLFETRHGLLVLLVLSVMLLIAGWIALRPLGDSRMTNYGWAALALLIGAGSNLLLVTQGVLNLSPWFAPMTLIPLGGMTLANAMNALSIAAERFQEEAAHRPFAEARATAFRAGMIPSINSLLAVGLVSLPGMMTGQILSGVDPQVAARYQIMVMALLFGGSGLTVAVYLGLLRFRGGSLSPPAPER